MVYLSTRGRPCQRLRPLCTRRWWAPPSPSTQASRASAGLPPCTLRWWTQRVRRTSSSLCAVPCWQHWRHCRLVPCLGSSPSQTSWACTTCAPPPPRCATSPSLSRSPCWCRWRSSCPCLHCSPQWGPSRSQSQQHWRLWSQSRASTAQEQTPAQLSPQAVPMGQRLPLPMAPRRRQLQAPRHPCIGAWRMGTPCGVSERPCWACWTTCGACSSRPSRPGLRGWARRQWGRGRRPWRTCCPPRRAPCIS
mmetsp:Transcript_4629/g.10021  ORF Transcript_4629/g.10021 Transcript_4629/m.10021 type:complete len:249 (-) Transcript_4629:1205-1951(-)